MVAASEVANASSRLYHNSTRDPWVSLLSPPLTPPPPPPPVALFIEHVSGIRLGRRAALTRVD